jgi:ferric-dicitrate binding protein FerR (iron transport regulator)
LADNENDKVNNLITRHLAGETSPQEEQQLHEWIARSRENELTFEKVKKVFDLASKARNDHHGLDLDVDQEWNLFMNRMESKGANRVVAMPASQNKWGTLLKAAAGLALLFTTTFTINYFISKNRDVRVETSNATEVVTLPDGSVVTLNKNSFLSYSPKFGEQARVLSLTGEAFFEVTADASRPFIIKVGEAEVQVVGTAFNVNGYDSQQEIEVIVETGKVRFTAGKSEVELNAGDRGVYDKVNRSLNQESNPDKNFDAWKTRKIIFEGATLQDIVSTLNEVYGNKLVLEGRFDGCQVTATFEHQSLEAVMNVLRTTLNLTLSTDNDQIKIVDAECQ